MHRAARVVRVLSLLALCSILTACPPPPPDYPIKGDGTYVSPNGHGDLTITDGFRLLRLSGDAYERGYAHGYLLPGEILTFLTDYVFWNVTDQGYDYQDVLDAQTQYILWEADDLAELNGMLDGIRDALPSTQRQVQPPGGTAREVSLGDLQAGNTLADWMGNLACSSFTIWGAGRGDGTTLHARNLDYVVDDQNAIKQLHVVSAVEGDGLANRWVSVGWPGLVGCISCFNEQGVTITMHDSSSLGMSTDHDLTPRMYAARRVMESVGSAHAPSQAEAILEALQATRGSNLHVSSPALGKADDDVAGVCEYDGLETHPDGGVTLRSPGDNPFLPVIGGYDHSLPETDRVIVTNHYVKRSTGGSGGSVDRYQILKEGLVTAAADGDTSPEEARLLMEAVGHTGTLHTVIFQPDDGLLRIYLAEPGQGAFQADPQILDFADLFTP